MDILGFLKDIGTIVKDSAEEWNDLCEETRNDFSKIFKDEFETQKKNVGDSLDNINPSLGDGFRKINEVGDNIENTLRSIANPMKNDQGKKVDSDLNKADHIFIDRIAFTHHGIYIGNGQVIHYARLYDEYISIQCCSLEEFADEQTVYKLNRDQSPIRFSADEAVRRATSRLGESDYNLIWNNCENFVRWCRFGSDK